ncbi:MAG: polysaccharide pyruvyl transferase CsaB [Eubacteriales bacterium]
MKILMTTMSLDIGGAETHIVELAKELTRRGMNVVVASNGGVFVQEIIYAGIRHLSLPLNSKNPAAVWRSYSGLYKLIKTEKFDIVHAHARIPGFICGLLAKRLHFRYVTTCHGVYNITPYWKLFSNWGERALAVSCDIKQYLIHNYKMNSDNIALTINGIDTERFSKENTAAGIISKHRVIFVSRIDHESAQVAFQLTQAAEELAKIYPDIEIIIAGSGTAISELRISTESMNEKIGRKVINLTGAITDVSQLLSLGGVFVGVSRSALEAMSAGLPVILAGSQDYSQGYLGIFRPDKLKEALDTNFCCRGCIWSTSELIKKDIISIFEENNSKLTEMGEYNRSVVNRYFTVHKMTDDVQAVYETLTPYEYYKNGDVVISGYYGFGNTGDDSLLAVIVEALRQLSPDIKITVLSKSPRKTERIYGIRAVNRFNLFAVIHALKHARLLINGSGNLITNVTSTRSLMYYIGIMKLAKKFGLRIMMYASGIGPLKGKNNKKAACDILNNTDIITLRENESARELNSIGVTNTNIMVTADPAYCIKPAAAEWIDFLMNREDIKKNGCYFAVALRHWNNTVDNFETKFTEAILKIRQNEGGIPLFIPMQISTDMPICRRIAAATGGKVVSGLSASELLGLFCHMRFVIAMRLHAAIYAASAGVPFIGLAYDMKINAMTAEYGLPYNIDVTLFESEMLISMVKEVIAHRQRICDIINEKTTVLRGKSLSDAVTAVGLLT